MEVFSFSIYGNHKKYCQGLIENLKSIPQYYPHFQIWIYYSSDVNTSWLQQYEALGAKLIHCEKGMFSRFYPLIDPEVKTCIIRDADSRIHARDRSCIDEFLSDESKKVHIIRDHPWHRSKFMGGLCAFKTGWNNSNLDMATLLEKYSDNINYSMDEKFLGSIIYPSLNLDQVLIHSNITLFPGEHITAIKVPHNETEFCGNVIDFNAEGKEFPQFNYYSGYNPIEHLNFIEQTENWALILELFPRFNVYKYNSSERYSYLTRIYRAFYNLSDIDNCQKVLALFESTHIDDNIIANSNCLFDLLRKKYRIIGTTFLNREPKGDEIIIYYGNYLHDYNCLPHSNKIYRHPYYFNSVHHNIFEYDSCWESIDNIYILNLKTRKDRYIEILNELCLMNAPLHKIYHYQCDKVSITGDKTLDTYAGATKNHLDVTDHFINISKGNHCLILEDDFTFTSNYQLHKKNFLRFFERKYDYDVCLIASSKYHNIQPHDDLLSRSYQECTTTAGYLLSKTTAPKVLACFEEGYKKMLETGDYHKYVCDRYWASLQKDNKFFVFKNKMGYQRCVYSSITEKTNMNFD